MQSLSNRLALAALLALSGCQLALDAACPDGGGCPAGSFCGDDKYCHPGEAASGTSSGATSGGSTSAETGVASTTSGPAAGSGSSSSGTGSSGASGGASGGTVSTTGSMPAARCAPGDAGPTGDAGILSAGPLTVSGTVTLPADAGVVSGQLYVQLAPLLGTSFHVCGPGTFAFTLHGLSLFSLFGSNALTAWLDPDPGVVSEVPGVDLSHQVSVSFAAVNAATQALRVEPPAAGQTPRAIAGVEAVEDDTGDVLVQWTVGDAGAADHYQVCIQPIGAPAIDAGVCRLFGPGLGGVGGLGILTAAVHDAGTFQAVVAAELAGTLGALTYAEVAAAPQGSPYLAGSVSGVPDAGAIVLIAEAPGELYFTQLAPGSSDFVLPVDADGGSYQIVAFVDGANTGQPSPGDLVDVAPGPGGPSFPACTPSSTCEVALPTVSSTASATVATLQGPETSFYSVDVRLYAGLKVPVSAFLLAPDGGDLMDLWLATAPGDPYVEYAGNLPYLSQPPALPFGLQVTYADLSTEVLSVGSSSYFRSTPAVSAFDAGVIAWTGPATDGGVDYAVSVCTVGCYPCTVFDGGFSGGTGAGFALDYNDTGASDVGVTITAVDGAGDTAVTFLGSCAANNPLALQSVYQSFGGFNPVLAGTVLYSGTAAAAPEAPIYVTLTQGDGGPVLAGQTVTAAAPNFFFYTAVGGDTLTAWMDVLGTGQWVPVAEPYGVAYTGGLTRGTVTLLDPAPASSPAAPTEPPTVSVGDLGYLVSFPPTPGFDHYVVNAYLDAPTLGPLPLVASSVVPAGAPPLVFFTAANVDGGLSNLEWGYAFTWAGVLAGVQTAETSPTNPPLLYPSGAGGGTSPLSGTVTADGLSSATTYVGVPANGDGGGDFQTYLPGTLDGSYSLQVSAESGGPQFGTGLWAFADRYGDGLVHPDDPGVAPFDTNSLAWSVVALPDGGPALTLSNDPVLCSVTSAQVNGNYLLTFQVASNLALPRNASVVSSLPMFPPVLQLGVPPSQVNHQLTFTGQQALGTMAPQPGESFNLSITFPDGGVTACTATLPE